MTTTNLLQLEQLEARDTPSTFGNAWPNAQEMTISFANDGALIPGVTQTGQDGGQTSGLFEEMSSAGTPAAWQMEILRAFQTWAAQTNINLGLIPESMFGGRPISFGPESLMAGKPEVGDIRIGAFQTSGDVIAVNQPYTMTSGEWAGTLLFNSTYDYAIGAQPGQFDIFSVALHEAGNIFGIQDNASPESVMYGHYAGVRSEMNAADIAAIQQLYGGARQADEFEGSKGNDTLDNATRLNAKNLPEDKSLQLVSAVGDLTTIKDVDHYVFKTNDETTSLVLRLNTAGRSLLTAKVTVFDKDNRVVASTVSGGPLGKQDILLTISNVNKKSEYYVRVERGTDEVFGIGSYELQVGYNFDPIESSTTHIPETYVADSGKTANGTSARATKLSAVYGADNQVFVYNGSIQGSTDVDWYTLKSPKNQARAMTITVTPEHTFTVIPQVTVYNKDGSLVPSEVLLNSTDGRIILQISNPTRNAQYFIRVASPTAGNYNLRVDFAQKAVELPTVANGALTNSRTMAFNTLTVKETQAFYFAFGITGQATSGNTKVRMTLFDAQGNAVKSITVNVGQTKTEQVILGAGTYFLRYEFYSNKPTPQSVSYFLRAQVVSDPIDPYAPVDPFAPPPPSSPSPLPPPSPEPTPTYVIEIDPMEYYAWLLVIDPMSNPWVPTP